MSLYRYTWVAVHQDGTIIQRWNPDGSENIPPAYPREFHLIASPAWKLEGGKNFSLFLREGQRLIFRKRRHVDSVGGGIPVEDQESVIYVVGIEDDFDCAHLAMYAFLLPDGRTEWSSDFNHTTIHERNLDAHPRRFYEE